MAALRPITPSQFEPQRPVYDPNDYENRPILSGGLTPPSSPPKSPQKPRSPNKSVKSPLSKTISPQVVSKLTGTPERVQFMPRKAEDEGDSLSKSRHGSKGKKQHQLQTGKGSLVDKLLGSSSTLKEDSEHVGQISPLTAANLSFINSVPTPPQLSSSNSSNLSLFTPKSSIPIPQTPQAKIQQSQPSIRAAVTPAAVRRKKMGLPGAEGVEKPILLRPPRSICAQSHFIQSPSTPMLSRNTGSPVPAFSAKDLANLDECDEDDICSTTTTTTKTNSKRDNVHVCVRVKNLSENGVWELDEARAGLCDIDTGNEYHFDSVVTGSSNKVVYNKAAKDIIVDCAKGYDALIFAYGQTASGKTFTLTGDPQSGNPGIIARSISEIFAFIRANPHREFLLRASYLEIYNEQLRDLLAPETTGQLRIRQDVQKRFFVSPLREELVTSEEAVTNLLRRGELVRHVGETDFNARSSRSHTVLQITIESRDAMVDFPKQKRGRPSIGTAVRISKLSLVDLAGSEKATGQADRRLEGGFINRSLLTLEKVIAALTDKSNLHIPFRDSKLTQILQSSLSGEARVAVVCTLNPTARAKEESKSTLRFATRIKKIILKAEQHEVLDDKALITKYKATIQQLEEKLAEKKAQESLVKYDNRQHQQEEQDVEDLKSQIAELQTLFVTSNNMDKLHEYVTPRAVSPIKDTRSSSSDEYDDEVLDLRQQIQSLRDKNTELEDTISYQHRHIADLENSLASRIPLLPEATDNEKDVRISELVQKVRELEVVVKNTDPELDLRRERRRIEKEWKNKLDKAAEETKRLNRELQLRQEWEEGVKLQLEEERKRTKALESFVMDKLQKTANRVISRERKGRPRSSSVGLIELPSIQNEIADVGRPSFGGMSTMGSF